MEKMIPCEKFSKKKQRQLNASRRNTWGRSEPRHQKAPEQQSLQQKKGTGLEARIAANSCAFSIGFMLQR